MDCQKTIFTGHAIRRMFQKKISRDDVAQVIDNGEVIADYPDDRPHPSCLLCALVNDRPIHVVVAYDAADKCCYIVTAYEPDPNLWQPGFRKRKLT